MPSADSYEKIGQRNSSGYHGYSPVGYIQTTPSVPKITKTGSQVDGVKIATSNLFVLNDIPPSIQATFDLVFESIAATELTSYLKHDMVNGQSTGNQIFSNLYGLSQQYNPLNIIGLNGTSTHYSNNFVYNLENYIPSVGYGTNGEIVYIDSSNNIVVNLINVTENERVEIEFVTYDSLKNATIYS